MNTFELHVRFTDAGDGWITAQIVEVPAATSQGRTREEARANVLDALREPAAHGAEVAPGVDVDVETLAVVAA